MKQGKPFWIETHAEVELKGNRPRHGSFDGHHVD